jgi:hypothetical protein
MSLSSINSLKKTYKLLIPNTANNYAYHHFIFWVLRCNELAPILRSQIKQRCLSIAQN